MREEKEKKKEIQKHLSSLSNELKNEERKCEKEKKKKVCCFVEIGRKTGRKLEDFVAEFNKLLNPFQIFVLDVCDFSLDLEIFFV